MIDFEPSDAVRVARDYNGRYAEEHMRPISREYDEHEPPWTSFAMPGRYRGQRNSLEASITNAQAGQMVTRVTQKVVEHLGPPG